MYTQRVALGLAIAASFVSSAAVAEAQRAVPEPPPVIIPGTFKHFANFPTRLVAPRNIDVWLPPEYSQSNDDYPVLYVQDGQNVFEAKTAFGGVEWGIDEAMSRLIAYKKVKPAIVVAIWNSPNRFQEYMPKKALGTATTFASGVAGMAPISGPMLSDAYLRFLTTELKPFIDQTFRTKPNRENTFIMGSSMGGLFSLYAVAELPGVFGGLASLSTHWPAADGAAIEYLRRTIPKASEHRLYFDLGTATLDTLYAPYQEKVDGILRAARYKDGENLSTRVFEGADHSERSWRARIDQPLMFLLKR